VALCPRGPGGDTAKVFLYEQIFGYSKEDFLFDYVEKMKGLAEIRRERGIPYKIIKLIAKFYSVLRDLESNKKIVAASHKNVSIATREKHSIFMRKLWSNKDFYDTNRKKLKKLFLVNMG
jgi:hypothetical protein